MALTKHDFFNALHVHTHLKNRIRYNDKLISAIIIDHYDPDAHASDILMAIEDGSVVSDENYKEYFKDSKIFISTTPSRKRKPNNPGDWIEISTKELDFLYQQVLEKVGSVNEDDLGEFKRIF